MQTNIELAQKALNKSIHASAKQMKKDGFTRDQFQTRMEAKFLNEEGEVNFDASEGNICSREEFDDLVYSAGTIWDK